jgi:hypothetical protein
MMESMLPVHFFVGAVFLFAVMAARPLIRLNLLLYRKLGFSNYADIWERCLDWWIPAMRVITGVLALVFFMLGFDILN